MVTKSMRFKKWLGTHAGSEKSFLDIALLIEDYLKKIPFAKIKDDVDGKQQSPEYRRFCALPQSNRGVLLHCILEIDEAIDLLSTPNERSKLVGLKNDLEAMYMNSSKKLAKLIQSILENFSEFLKIEARSFSDIKKARELYYSFYLSLCLVNLSLIQLPSWAGFLAKFYDINIQNSHLFVKELLKQFEEKIMTIEAVFVQKAQYELVATSILDQTDSNIVHNNTVQVEEVIQEMPNKAQVDSPGVKTVDEQEITEFLLESTFGSETLELKDGLSSTQQSIQKYFDERYLAIILDNNTSAEKLKALLELSTTIQSAIERLNELRAQEQAFLARRKTIHTLHEVFNKNDSYIIGRKYFTQLKEQYEQEFKLLIELSVGPEKDRLLANIKAQQEQAGSKTQKGLYFLSTIFSPLTALSRTVLSTENQEYIASWSPDTLDAQAKRITKELAKGVLADLDDKLLRWRTAQRQILSELGAGSKPLASLIAAESSHSLATLAQLNTMKEHYEDLIDEIKIESLPAIHVKTLIQDAFQPRYARLMLGSADEKSKVYSLITYMRSVVKELNRLLELQFKKNEIEFKLNSFKALLDAIYKMDNKLFAVVANNPIKELQKELFAIRKEIFAISTGLSQENSTLQSHLIQCSAEELKELIQTNTVSDTLDAQLLTLVCPIAEADQLVAGEETILDSFKELYLSLLNDDTHEEWVRLEKLNHYMEEVNSTIQLVLAARKNSEALSKRERHMQSLVDTVQSHGSNALLVNLLKERLTTMSKEALVATQKTESLILGLVPDNVKLKTLLLQQDPSDLTNLIAVNQAAKECIEQFKALKDRISLLNNLKNGICLLDAYSKENNTWWVRFTDFLARFCLLFKSHTGKMIDQANLLKQDLIACRVACEHEISTHINEVDENPVLGKDLLGDLPQRYDFLDEDSSTLPLDPQKAIHLLSSVSMFNPKFTLDKQEEVTTNDQIEEPDFMLPPDDLLFSSCH